MGFDQYVTVTDSLIPFTSFATKHFIRRDEHYVVNTLISFARRSCAGDAALKNVMKKFHEDVKVRRFKPRHPRHGIAAGRAAHDLISRQERSKAKMVELANVESEP